MTITFLGTGTSQGVPIINCNCDVCSSDDARDKRLRTSVFIQSGHASLLIDTSPDLRQQLLRNRVERIDAILYTHSHADHILGVDEIRRFNYLQNERIKVYGNQSTMDRMQTVFDYAFVNSALNFGIPNLTANVIGNGFEIMGEPILPLELKHGTQTILGYRIGDFAYCTDVSEIPETTIHKLSGLKVLILDALREKPHPTHFSLQQAIDQALSIKAEKTYFIHMSHKISHQKHGRLLPESMAFAYDTLKLTIDAKGQINETTGA